MTPDAFNLDSTNHSALVDTSSYIWILSPALNVTSASTANFRTPIATIPGSIYFSSFTVKSDTWPSIAVDAVDSGTQTPVD